MAHVAICSREKASRQFRQLRNILNPSASSGLDRIDVPNAYAVLRIGEEVPRIPLVVKEEIEEVLLPHTEQRFRQHQETPFGHGHRQQSLGVDCTSEDAEALMEGTYDRELDQLSEEAHVWLQQLSPMTLFERSVLSPLTFPLTTGLPAGPRCARVLHRLPVHTTATISQQRSLHVFLKITQIIQ